MRPPHRLGNLCVRIVPAPLLAAPSAGSAWEERGRVAGSVTDPEIRPVASARTADDARRMRDHRGEDGPLDFTGQGGPRDLARRGQATASIGYSPDETTDLLLFGMCSSFDRTLPVTGPSTNAPQERRPPALASVPVRGAHDAADPGPAAAR